ncbi:MAG: hypothetical protein AB7I41_03720 [Candidatus Sericytochromatia bacterium]
MSDWKVIRITLPPRYYRQGIYQALERSIILTLTHGLDLALQKGLLQEVHPARKARPARRFLIYLSDAQQGHEIPVSFSLSHQGQVL